MPTFDARNPPLGARWGDGGVCFSLASRHATAVELCLFEDLESPRESRRIALERQAEDRWAIFVPGLGPGALYGYRIDGPYEPQNGHRFNPSKLLIDPWARAITGEPRRNGALFAYDREARPPELSYDSRDSAPAMPRCVVVDPRFVWEADHPPRVAWRASVIYECHVRGMTRLHPGIDPRLRGTYLGLGEPPVIEHLRALGVTAVELLPIFQIASEWHLLEKGLRNYWGYSTLGYFAPHAGYATGCRGEQVVEFKTMVRRLHEAGIEVVLDVVYNHTAEAGHLGPTLSLKGIDTASYYRLSPHDRRFFEDWSGCGNALDPASPLASELILASLRYWVEEMHVDGFRFDLAPSLGRAEGHFDSNAPLIEAIAADPVLREVKLIAEPWDLGPGGYQLGRFPASWAEWNDRYRDAARRFWIGHGNGGELAQRLTGSRDHFPSAGVHGSRPINFITCHDGFTLADLVSYERKHNEANAEDNRDGSNHNLSCNWGAEGPTDDPAIRRTRRRARCNLLATLALSRGVPMLLHGDEIGRSQRGNNNAYCQDNELAWMSWALDEEGQAFFEFVQRLMTLRASHPLLREGGNLTGWLVPGQSVSVEALAERKLDALGIMITPAPVVPEEVRGALLLLLNGSEVDLDCHLPRRPGRWRELLDTAIEGPVEREHEGVMRLPARSLILLEGMRE